MPLFQESSNFVAHGPFVDGPANINIHNEIREYSEYLTVES